MSASRCGSCWRCLLDDTVSGCGGTRAEKPFRGPDLVAVSAAVVYDAAMVVYSNRGPGSPHRGMSTLLEYCGPLLRVSGGPIFLI